MDMLCFFYGFVYAVRLLFYISVRGFVFICLVFLLPNFLRIFHFNFFLYCLFFALCIGFYAVFRCLTSYWRLVSLFVFACRTYLCLTFASSGGIINKQG